MRQQSRHLPAFVLLLLAETPTHGGALQSALNQRFPSLKADSAAVYRTLKQLEKDGEVGSSWITANSGPAVRVYTLTPLGWEQLEFWRGDIAERMQNFDRFIAVHEGLKSAREP
ncbi:MAG: helix-turn-helix transcriptional regulator [Pseudolabrys sp.]